MSQENVEAVTERVASLLNTNPDLRDDDRKLWVSYLVEYCDLKDSLGHEAFQIFLSVIEKCPSYETVRRSRQKLQEAGKFLGNNRKKRNEDLRELKEFSKKTPEQILNI